MAVDKKANVEDTDLENVNGGGLNVIGRWVKDSNVGETDNALDIFDEMVGVAPGLPAETLDDDTEGNTTFTNMTSGKIVRP